jgi:hypothetical protein
MTEDQPKTFCYIHPTVETALRCNQCGEYICAKCAVHTPTGYRCNACIRQQQKKFDTSQPMDLVFAVVVAGVLSFLGSLVISWVVGFWGFLSIFLAPIAGTIIGEAARKVTGRRRSKKLFQAVWMATAVGALPLFIFNLLIFLLTLGSGAGGWLSILRPVWFGYYLVTVTTTAYFRISGQPLRLKR